MNKDQIVTLAAETGVKAAIEYMEEQRKKQVKSRHDKRLRNTRLLLKNYHLLKEHCSRSVYSLQQTTENAIDILDAMERFDSKTYIESIKKSVTRTYIILTHIDTMLDLYAVYCEKSKREEDKRRYRVLSAYYFENVEMAEIMRREGIEERTCYRDIRDACEKLSALIFGMDSIMDMS
ncbi:MAG: hypothetical protein N2491_01750 [Negativicutes bacterium]|nr:hypothetical protein [Negativicutes bacterium]